jgi:OHCU decarboxylase
VTPGLERLNALGRPEAEASLLSCCGSREWARRVADERPFRSAEDLGEAADRIWRSLGREEWLEAFAAHPKIGSSAEKGDDRSRDWSRREQGRVAGASSETLAELADVNRAYEERFGHIFIVCAAGKSAAEMLAQARARLHNDPRSELAIAAEEQRRIMRLRLAKLLDGEGL